ncbi:class I SAM-dependent methyltransferase [Aureitalea marina]|uniref:Methyltransferase domain-containing protein n=1 Tax=Aureitalea marina TaxID=930804 RepID=A0A2S7KMP0_9FLAO|nr:class I SAM-dependent methyltransferase [Aureitalea marina]PQB03872.1 hypothetical protein BST85_02345 [Aureitalea marina]
MSKNNKVHFSCLLDSNPIMDAQCYVWVNSLLAQNISPAFIHVHIVGSPSNAIKDFLVELNVILHYHNAPFDPTNLYCNKLLQLDYFFDLPQGEYVALMDCDTALVAPFDLNFDQPVYSKIVDLPNPPFELIRKAYEKAGLPVSTVKTSLNNKDGDKTVANNCNGGLYLIAAEFIHDLSIHWKKWSKWCIENKDLFGVEYEKHADQLGFAMAMTQMGKTVSYLDLAHNFPTHLSNYGLPDARPVVLHFHDRLDEHMRLKGMNLPLADQAIQELNDILNEQLNRSLNNAIFWSFRYAKYPGLGSGVGSRGATLEYKQRLIRYSSYPFQNKPVLDVGCGDLELMKGFNFEQYTGLDVSEQSLVLSRSKRPEWSFSTKALTDPDIKQADLILCFDVLIHQKSSDDFYSLVKGIIAKSDGRIVVGAYHDQPEFTSHITYYYESILNLIIGSDEFDEIAIIGHYRDITVVAATKGQTDHKRDIGSQDLNRAFREVNRPDLLLYLSDISRSKLGFYTSHYPRVFEYTWIYEQIENLQPGSILDLGAGVCPLPIAFNELGFEVTTVDLHSKVRLAEEKAEWNEWGFLDYEQISKGIRSFNVDFTNFKSNKKFDVIYSVSVIEHMPKRMRRKILKKVRSLLQKGGKAIFTIDLVPGTDDLWNFSEGKEVEDRKTHGDLNMFRKELRRVGVRIEYENIQREVFNSRTDLYYVIATAVKKSVF